MTEKIKALIHNKYIKIGIVGLLACLAALSIFQGAKNAAEFSQDFQWDAARALMEGIDPYEVSNNPGLSDTSDSLKEFYGLFTQKGLKQKMEANQFPSLLMLLFPVAYLPPLTARFVWLSLNMIFTVGIVFLLKITFLRNLSQFEYMVTVLLMLAGTPYRNQIGVGRHTLFSFFFFLLAVWLDEKKPKGNRIPITLCMFISYFKYTLTAPLTLYLLYKKRYEEFIFSVLMHGILTIAAAFMLKKSIVYVLTAPLKVASVLGSEGGIDLGVIFGGTGYGYLAGGMVALALIAIAILLPENKGYILFPLLCAWSLVITYHRTYDFFVMAGFMGIFSGDLTKELDYKKEAALKIYLYIVMFMVYFVLRVFSESKLSLMVVGAFYYVLAVLITIVAIISIKNKKKVI